MYYFYGFVHIYIFILSIIFFMLILKGFKKKKHDVYVV